MTISVLTSRAGLFGEVINKLFIMLIGLGTYLFPAILIFIGIAIMNQG